MMKQTYPIPHDDALLARFNRLMQEVLDGNVRRKSFKLWEADILLDIMSCQLKGQAMPDLLRRYQKAVQLQMTSGPRLPLKLSEYLEAVKMKGTETKRAATKRSIRPRVSRQTYSQTRKAG